MSIRAEFFRGSVLLALVCSAIFTPRRNETQHTRRLVNCPAKFDHSLNHFIRGFQHNEFLSAGEADDGVRRRLDMLDEIRVQDQSHMVDSSQMDHRAAECPYAALIDAYDRIFNELLSETATQAWPVNLLQHIGERL
jgi:hypothetical protein